MTNGSLLLILMLFHLSVSYAASIRLLPQTYHGTILIQPLYVVIHVNKNNMSMLAGSTYSDFHPKKGIIIRPVIWNRNPQKMIDWLIGWDQTSPIKKEPAIDVASSEKEIPF